MKTRKIISIMAALLMTVTVTGCNGSGELFTVSTEPPVSEVSEDESRTNEEAKGELVPKITANPSVSSNRTKDIAMEDGLFGSSGDMLYETAPALKGEAVTNDIERFAEAPTTDIPTTDTAPADIAPTAPAPGYYDDFYDYPQTKPQAGLLTAGEWNDNDNWGFFTNLINNDKIEIPSDYGLNPTQRIAVTVRDKSENPVVNASVRGFSEGGKLVWSAVTDKNGIAYLFKGDEIANVKAESQVATAENSVKSEIKNDEQTVIKANNAEVNITLDGEGENYEKTEIMFVVDTTGSMGDELMFLQSEFTAIAEEIGTDNTKFSINFYRDDGDDYTTKRYPFSSDIEEINKKLNSEYATGGGDLPEAVAEILDETINDGGWSDESVKLMFMIFDAPPHDDKADKLESAVKKAAERGIRIIPVVSSNSDRNTELFGRSAAIMTGGTYVFLTDDSGIGYSHLEPIIGEHKVEKLYDIIVRIINEYKQGEIKMPSEPSEVSEISEISEETKEVSEIIDRTVTEPISTDTALEKFYEDDGNEYFYGSIKSEYVIVKYTDGTQETVVSALKNGKITLSDLDKYGISYIKQPKAKTLPGNISVGKFSFKDEKDYSGKTDGFVNTNEIEMTDVVARAKAEIQGEYGMTQVFYDETEDMWKVHFFNSDTAGGDVSVYLNGKGVTKLIAYGE